MTTLASCHFRNPVCSLAAGAASCRRRIRPARAPRSAGAKDPRARAQARVAGRSDEGRRSDDAGRTRVAAAGLPHSVRGRRQRGAPARRAAIRRPLTSPTTSRRRPRTPGSCGACGRPRRHAQRHLRFPLHAGLRRRPHDHSGCVTSRRASSRGRSLTAGKFKVPVGLERLESATDIRFIERGFPTSLVPNRDLGVHSAAMLPAAS